MKGASASTAVASISNKPVTHKKMANGVSERLSGPPCHNPRTSCAVDPNVLPNTISPRRVLPRVLIKQLPPLLCPVGFLPWLIFVLLLESLRRQAHRCCSAGMWSNLRLHDSRSVLQLD